MTGGFLQLLGYLAVPRLEAPPPTVVDSPPEKPPNSDQTRTLMIINRKFGDR